VNKKTLEWICGKINMDPAEFLAYDFYEQSFGRDEFLFSGFHCKQKWITQIRAGIAKRKKIVIPPKDLLFIQKRIRDKILWPFIKKAGINFKYSHGGFKEHSITTYSNPHDGNRFFFVFDLRKAYPSVRIEQIKKCLINIGLYPDVAQTIIELNTYNNHLPIGFGASPLLFNLILNVVDNRIAYFLQQQTDVFSEWKIVFTRYYDDCIISSLFEIEKYVREGIKEILLDYGFRLHPRKTIYQDVTKKAIKQVGLTITDHGIILSKQRRRNMEGVLLLAIRDPEKWKPIIDGKIGFFKMIYGKDLPKRIDKFLQEFDHAHAQAWRKSRDLPPI